jgi:Raf kinase inhibitor-like YbhB/YbcL family protein
MTLKLTSTAFENGQPIPARYTGEGADMSPPLQRSGAPQGTKSLALICDDPDAPAGTWVHWVLWNLPAATKQLDEHVAKTATLPNGACQGSNDFPGIGYDGPMPPPGKPHRYFFKLYALDTTLSLKAGATKQDLLDAMKGHIVAEGQLMGTYHRGR